MGWKCHNCGYDNSVTSDIHGFFTVYDEWQCLLDDIELNVAKRKMAEQASRELMICRGCGTVHLFDENNKIIEWKDR